MEGPSKGTSHASDTPAPIRNFSREASRFGLRLTLCGWARTIFNHLLTFYCTMSLPTSRRLANPLTRQLKPSLRSFSSTTNNLQDVPPDSPFYIRLPTPPQVNEKKRERVRGFLPVPREVFPRGHGERKLDPEYLNKTAPKPQRPQTGTGQRKWKAELADSRRKGLEDGLKELWKRHSREETARNARSRANFFGNHQRRVAPEREDDRLTRGTTLESLLDTKVYPDPDRFSKADRGRDKVLAADKAKRDARRDALMELYISASNFITNETELRQEIDTIFHPDYFKNNSTALAHFGADNAWGTYSQPPSVASMLEDAARTSSKLVDAGTSEYDRSAFRQKRIAEEFTGGKMDV